MASITWKGNVSPFLWSDAADWSTDTVPGAGDIVSIPSGVQTCVVSGSAAAAAAVTNAGGLTIDNTLSVTSAFSNTGTTTVSGTLSAGSIANTGTLNIFGGTVDIAGAAGFGGQTGVLTGAVDIGNNGGGLLEFGSGEITTIAGSATLDLVGDNSFVADAGGITSNGALNGLSTVDGTLGLFAGASVTTTGNLADNGSISVDGVFASANGGSTLTVDGLLNVTGSLSIGAPGIAAAVLVSVNAIANTGTIIIMSSSIGGASVVPAVLDVGSVAGFGGQTGVLTGTVGIGSEGIPTAGFTSFTGLLEFASGQINTIAAGAQLSLLGPDSFVADAGATASNSALIGLTTINGSLATVYDVLISTAGPLTVGSNGSITEDHSAFGLGGSVISIGGTLTNDGTVTIGSNGNTGNSTLTASGLVNAAGATINLNGDFCNNAAGLLLVNAAAGFGTAGVLTGNVNLTGLSLMQFASGQITTIAYPSTLFIDGPSAFLADAGSPASNSALAGLSAVKGTLTLTAGASVATSGDLAVGNGTNDGFANINDGGNLAVAGVLSLNSFGTVNIGAGSDAAQTLVTANGLSLAGGGSPATLNMTGSDAGAIFEVASTAGTGVAGQISGNISLAGNSLLQFASGQIDTIAVNSTLTLTGANAFVADAGATSSNSALQGLTTIDGTLTLLNGASVATTAGDLTLGEPDHGAEITVQNGSDLAIGGTLLLNTSQANLSIGVPSETAQSTVTASGVTFLGGNSGITIRGGLMGAVLDLASAAGFGTAGVLSGGSIDLENNRCWNSPAATSTPSPLAPR